MSLVIDTIKPYVPFLLGLDVLDKCMFAVDNVENKTINKALGQSVQITLKKERLIFDLVLFFCTVSRMELKKIQ